MKISLVALSTIIFISSITQTFAQKHIVEKLQIRHSLESFKAFFTVNKNPSPDLIKKTFGEPVLYTLTIGDNIAKQKGQLKLRIAEENKSSKNE